MRDTQTLIREAAPRPTRPLDVVATIAAGKRRRTRRRAAAAVGAVASALLVGTLAVDLLTPTVTPDVVDTVVTESPAIVEEQSAEIAPSRTTVAVETIALDGLDPRSWSWHHQLDDGRVVVWSGAMPEQDVHELDGFVIDPLAATASAIPPAPIDGHLTRSSSDGQRLLVWDAGTRELAVHDLDGGEWTSLPRLPDIPVRKRGWAALHEDTVTYVTLARVSSDGGLEPAAFRLAIGSETWEPIESPGVSGEPLAWQDDGHRLLWNGPHAPWESGATPRVLDLATARWETLEPLPFGGELNLIEGGVALVGDQDGVPQVLVHRAGEGWQELALPDGAIGASTSHHGPTFAYAGSVLPDGTPSQRRAWVRQTDGWVPAPRGAMVGAAGRLSTGFPLFTGAHEGASARRQLDRRWYVWDGADWTGMDQAVEERWDPLRISHPNGILEIGGWDRPNDEPGARWSQDAISIVLR